MQTLLLAAQWLSCKCTYQTKLGYIAQRFVLLVLFICILINAITNIFSTPSCRLLTTSWPVHLGRWLRPVPSLITFIVVQHGDSQNSFWGRPGGGAPMAQEHIKKANLDQILYSPRREVRSSATSQFCHSCGNVRQFRFHFHNLRSRLPLYLIDSFLYVFC